MTPTQRAIIAAITAQPGATREQITAALKINQTAARVAIVHLERDGEIGWRVYEGVTTYFPKGKAPKCHHNMARPAIGAIDPADVCCYCGAMRAHRATTWGPGHD